MSIQRDHGPRAAGGSTMPSVRNSWLRAAGGSAALVVLYFAVPLDDELSSTGLAARLVVSVAAVGICGWLIGWQVKRQLAGGEPPLAGLLLALIGAILLFAVMDYLLATADPSQFEGLETRLDSLYFTLTTLATVGYGDVHAKGQTARALISVQLVFNLVVIATGASVLSRRIAARARERRRSES